MKVMTILGTRPEIIRLCRVIPLLDQACPHVVVHTGQNYDPALKDVFFEELRLRAPDESLQARGSPGEQIGIILAGCERLFQKHRPDRCLILGDTNSGLAALVAKRLGIAVYHMEAGNRCFDDRVPEEVNRRVIDHCSDVLLPYTERSRDNLLREGIPSQRIYVTGNPIFEVLEQYRSEISVSTVLSRLGLSPGGYFLVTLHRAENVDPPERLARLLTALRAVAARYQQPIVISTHPRTRSRLATLPDELRDGRTAVPGATTSPALAPSTSATDDAWLRFLDPFPFFDFVHLEQQARCVLSDSGTVQEECAIFRQPNVTLRDVTERPETLECGSNILAGSHPEQILLAVSQALSTPPTWTPPAEYLATGVAERVVRIVVGHREA